MNYIIKFTILLFSSHLTMKSMESNMAINSNNLFTINSHRESEEEFKYDDLIENFRNNNRNQDNITETIINSHLTMEIAPRTIIQEDSSMNQSIISHRSMDMDHRPREIGRRPRVCVRIFNYFRDINNTVIAIQESDAYIMFINSPEYQRSLDREIIKHKILSVMVVLLGIYLIIDHIF